MKKFALIAVMAMSGSAFAAGTAVCNATGVGAAFSVTAGNMITTAFTPKCSANTYVNLEDDTQYAAAGAASKKGNESYMGHTNGGAVKKNAACSADPCTATDASDASAAGLTAATGSSS